MSMTWAQFDNGYWYTTELKEFAETIGIPSASKLRKDGLEKATNLFHRCAKTSSRKPTNSSSRPAKSRARLSEASRPQAPKTSNEGWASIFRWWSTRTTRKPNLSWNEKLRDSLQA